MSLVACGQLAVLIPMASEISSVEQTRLDDSAARAGALYDRFARDRAESLRLVAESFALDEPFGPQLSRQSIEPRLRRHAALAGIDTAAVFDLSGNVVASLGRGRELWSVVAMERFSIAAGNAGPTSAIGRVGSQPYHAVTLQLGTPVLGWLTVGLPIDQGFVQDVKSMTGFDATIVGFGVGRKSVYATTISDELDSAMEQISLAIGMVGNSGIERNDVWLTNLRPYLDNIENLYVALQVPVASGLVAFDAAGTRLFGMAALSLVLAVAVAVGLSRMLIQRIQQVADTARRLADGLYSQPIPTGPGDELDELAEVFNAMQEAVASREREIVRSAHHHSLSGLPTREAIVADIASAIAASRQVAIVNLVLHGFDEIASSLGHRTAEQLIQMAAGNLQDQLKDNELLAHLNQYEFALVLPGASEEEARDRANSIEALLRSGIAVGNANIALQMRAGIAMYPRDGSNASELLRSAGIARTHAGHNMGSVGVYEPEQEERSLELIQIVGDFPRALKNHELWVAYQPKIECNSLAVCGAEALVRWNHPRLGELRPDIFVAAVEQAGGISQLTRWVLEEAVLALVRWGRQGLTPTMSVNISAQDLLDGYLARFLESLCSRHAVAPSALTLEVTESSIMHDVETSLSVIHAVRALGCRVSIDDFGTGHSSLSQLRRLPVDELKIDKSFVLNIEDPRDEAVVRTAIELGHKFGLSVVAEGVETETCLMRLQQLGCEVAQGFLFSRPLMVEDFVAWVERWAAAGGADIYSLVDEGRENRDVELPMPLGRQT